MSKKINYLNIFFSDKITTETNACVLPSLTISEPKEKLNKKPQKNFKKKNTMSSLSHWKTVEKNQCFRFNSDDPFQ